MKRIIEIYRFRKTCKERLEELGAKGVKIDPKNMTATSSYLEIVIIQGGKTLLEKLDGHTADSIEIDYFPALDIVRKMQSIAKDDLSIMGTIFE